ncbi:hypothetical protein [Janthinobacterium sp. JC611]|uniref:hypothetical protein n=1 Tax=Janthinobacterium sp. JC611 TaxID=2816201 RepID=UPI001BFEDAA5|nr:hypothetical protein [Janthinobacterium sp. JC611]
MPVGASPRREREFKQLEKEFKQEGRYPGREEEVAARIVNKQRAQAGETRAAPERKKASSPASDAPASDLPIAGYQHLTVAQIRDRLGGLSDAQRQRLHAYEVAHKKRKGVLQALQA